MGRLEGKVAIVTGAARGTGEATARLFVEEGARVLVSDVMDDPGEKVAADLGDAALYQHLDVTSEDDWKQAVSTTLDKFGSLDVLVNNAGILLLAAIEDTQAADYERVLRVNTFGAFLGVRTVVEPMRNGGGGSIVNLCSVDGLSAKNGLIAYASSKWAMRGMTRVAAIELGKWNIRVNTVCPEGGSAEMISPYVPDGIDPAWVQGYNQRLLAYQQDRSNEDRLRDIAKMVAFVASDDAASSTGSDFAVDSGNTAGRQVKGAPGA